MLNQFEYGLPVSIVLRIRDHSHNTWRSGCLLAVALSQEDNEIGCAMGAIYFGRTSFTPNASGKIYTVSGNGSLQRITEKQSAIA